MRQIIHAGLLAASVLLAAAPVAAESPVRLPTLAPGEVLLEVDGIGIVRTPASVATVTTTAYGYGRTAEAARRSLARDVERVRAAARAAGATDADISTEPVAVTDEIRMHVVAARIQAGDIEIAGDGVDAASDVANRVVIRLRNAGRAAELNSDLNPGGPYRLRAGPVYEIADPAAARRQARSAALGQARADADAFAEALGMRVVRTLRVTDRAGFDFFGALITDPAAMDYVSRLGPAFLWEDRQPRAEVATGAVVGVDYVLAPR